MKAFSSCQLFILLANFVILKILTSSFILCEVVTEKGGKVNKIEVFDENGNKDSENSNESSEEDVENPYQDGRSLFRPKISGNLLIDILLRFVRIGMRAFGVNQIKVKNIKIPILSTSIVINGHLSGVDSIQRDGDFNIELGLIRKSKFRAGFKIGRLNGFLSIKVNETEQKIKISLEDISIRAEFEFKLIRIPPKIKMTEFRLSAGDLKGDFENLGLGLGLLDDVGELGVETIDKIKDPILEAVSDGIKTLVNSAIKDISILSLFGR